VTAAEPVAADFLSRWFAVLDSDTPERVLDMIAPDFRFVVLWAVDGAAAEFSGAVAELEGYLEQREPDGQVHHVDVITREGGREVAFGHTTRHGEQLATFTAAAELDASGHLRRLLAARTTAIAF
jgi:hypothetical protein